MNGVRAGVVSGKVWIEVIKSCKGQREKFEESVVDNSNTEVHKN